MPPAREAIRDKLAAVEKALGILAVAGVFSLIYALCHRAIFDPDIWLHLKTGELILANKGVPAYDIFSFSVAGRPWLDHQWLFQIISFLAFSCFGYEGLISLAGWVILASFFILFLIGWRSLKSYLEVAALLLLAGYASADRFNIRPDMFSLFFFALYLYILKGPAPGKAIWIIPPLQIIWVNTHGYFALGPLLVFFFLAAEFLRRRPGFSPLPAAQEPFAAVAAYKRLKAVFLLSLACCLLNPRLFAGAFYPLRVIQETLYGQNKIFFAHIRELKATFGAAGAAYYLAAAFAFLCLAVNFRRLRLSDIFLAVSFFIFGLTARNVPFFIFISYLLVVSYLAPFLRGIFSRSLREGLRQQIVYLLLRCLLALCLVLWMLGRIAALLADNYYDFRQGKFISLCLGVDERQFPRRAVDFLLENNFKADLFNDFNSGAYLIGRAYPRIRAFVDGRTELYGAEFFRFYQAAMNGEPAAWKTLLEKYNIGAALLSIGPKLPARALKYFAGLPGEWTLVFLDECGAVFLREEPRNRQLIKQHAIDLSRYVAPAADLKRLGAAKVYPWAYLRRAEAWQAMGKDDLAIQEAVQAIRVSPDCARAYYILGKAYLRRLK